jgi:hypothetical protein
MGDIVIPKENMVKDRISNMLVNSKRWDVERGCRIETNEMDTSLISNRTFHHTRLLRTIKQNNICELSN